MLLAVSTGVLLLLAFHGGQTPLGAQEDDEMSASREHQIKAAYLYQFGRYVEWPPKSFANSKSPFVIGLPEHDPLVPNLEQIARVKKIQDRPIRIRQFSSPADIRAVPHRVSAWVAYPGGTNRGDPQDRTARRTHLWGIPMDFSNGGEPCNLSLKTIKSAWSSPEKPRNTPD